MLMFLTVSLAVALSASSEFESCAKIVADSARLTCYDNLSGAKANTNGVKTENSSRWKTSTSSSELDGSKTITVSIAAEGQINIWPNKKATPTLVIRCKGRDTEVFLVTGSTAEPERGRVGVASGRIRVDEGRVEEVSLSESVNGQSLFFTSPFGVLSKWLKKSKLRLEFTPFNTNPQVVTFLISGIDEAITPVRTACNW